MSVYAAPAPRTAVRLPRLDGAIIFLLVGGAQFVFGAWMASRGFRFGDAFYRSTGALFALHSSDPKLADIGFVWMPLPALLSLPAAALYPLWPDAVASGAAGALASAVCGGATASLLIFTAGRLGLSRGVGWAFALLVSVSPMLFLYSGTGMSEGVCAPFLIGAVAFLTLFWHTGQRGWVGASGIAMALAVLSKYEAVPYGAALFAALVGGILFSLEARPSAPLGRARAVEGLGLLLLVPSIFTGLAWMVANAAIMGDPLFFARGAYGYSSYQGDAFTAGNLSAKGDPAAVAALMAPRAWPFLIPLVFLLAARAADGRLRRVETVSLVVVSLSVIVGLIAPMAFLGSRMDFLRYYMFPLYAAAGWGLYEIAASRRRRRAAALVLAGWVVAIPVSLWAMSTPRLGVQEYPELKALVTGKDALALGYGDPVVTRARLAAYLDDHVLARGQRVLLDAYQGAAIAVQTHASDRLIMSFDRRFQAALADPVRNHIHFVLLPDPAFWPQDAVNRLRPRLWAGKEPGFRLVRAFPAGPGFDLPESWRLYAVGNGVRVLPKPNGGGG